MIDRERHAGKTQMENGSTMACIGRCSSPGPPGGVDGRPQNTGHRMAMTADIVIRKETAADVAAITEVTVAAFETLGISNHTEQFIIEALRAAGALTLSLVAVVEGRLVGHIAFSPVTISDGTSDWYGIGPVSVLPEYQRRGFGTALIRQGLARLHDLGARGCCLVGHPEYYKKFGFENVSELVMEGVPSEVFFALSFNGLYPQGKVTFHEGFKADGR